MQDVDIDDVLSAGTDIVTLEDVELLSLARRGHRQAYAALCARYSYVAHRLARHLGRREDAEDVVSESFAQALDLVSRGEWPGSSFRGHLFTAIRHESARRARARRRLVPIDREGADRPVPYGGGDLEGFERTAIRAAYDSMPLR